MSLAQLRGLIWENTESTATNVVCVSPPCPQHTQTAYVTHLSERFFNLFFNGLRKYMIIVPPANH